MSLVYAAYVGVPLVTAPINAGLAAWVYVHHEDVRGSRWFAATMAIGAAWMLMAALEFLLPTADLQILATMFSTKLAILAFVTFVVFASRYTNTDFHRHWVVVGLVGFVVAVVLMPTWIEPFQSLFYADWATDSQPIRHVAPEPGPLYAPMAIVVAVLAGYAPYALLRYVLSTPRQSGLQLVALVLGSLSIMIAIVLGNLGAFPIQEATNARFGSLPFSVMTSLALFRFRLFEMQPVARNAVVENLRDPVLVVDRHRHLVDYNPATVDVWPRVDGAVGDSLAEACPDVAALLPSPDPTAVETSDISVVVDGQQRHYSLDVSTVGGEDDPTLYAVLLRDVTDLERSRRQLQAQNERLDQVAATISHDLRNPINVAGGYSEMAAERLAADAPDPEALDAARDDVLRIQGAHERMEAIIDDVLTLAREGQTVDETEAVSLWTAAHEAWEHVETDEATLNIADGRGLAADRSKLLTLLENLYRNAVEHGSTSPRSSSTHEDAVEHGGADVSVTVGALEDGFYVEDDGPGIPGEQREDVFEYGYTTADDGTGLGLSIVRTIAESHGWTVALDPDAGDGARFVVRSVDAADPGVADRHAADPDSTPAADGPDVDTSTPRRD